MPRAYSVDLRERSLAAMTAGMSMTEAARIFAVSRSTLSRWRQRQQTTGSLHPGQSSGRPRRLTPAHEAVLLTQLQAQPDLTLAELCAAAPVRVSATTMSRTVRRLGVTRKKRA